MEHRRGVRVKLAVAVVAVVLVAALVAGGVALARYQPLERGSSWWHSSSVYREGRPFRWAVALRNDGRLPVTLTGVDAGNPTLVRTVRVRMSDDARSFPPRSRFARRLRVPAGREASVVVDAVFTGCTRYSVGTSVVYGAIRVRYEVLGVPRSAWVDLGQIFTIRRPDRCR